MTTGRDSITMQSIMVFDHNQPSKMYSVFNREPNMRLTNLCEDGLHATCSNWNLRQLDFRWSGAHNFHCHCLCHNASRVDCELLIRTSQPR